MKSMVEIKNLSKSFKTDFWKKQVQALDNVSFDVVEGSIFGLIGHNGAGKTTLIKVLMGLIKPTSGQATIFGKDSTDSEARGNLGYLPESAYYYDYLRADEILRFYAGLFGLSRSVTDRRIDELLEMVGLSHRKDIRLRYFSKGMLQRIGIAQALINDPQLVVLDEPMSGLDPMGRKEVRDIILQLRKKGKTIIFSSHILSDVEALCDHVSILVKGKLNAFGALNELIQPKTKDIEIVFKGSSSITWPKDLNILESRVVAHNTIATLGDPSKMRQVLTYALSQGLELLSAIPHRESLEDLFVELSERKS